MKQYYVHYYKDFGNTYNLAWAETPEQIKAAEDAGYQKITRREAENLCAEENGRRKSDAAFSGYADSVILPIEYAHSDWQNDRHLRQNGYIVEHIEKK